MRVDCVSCVLAFALAGAACAPARDGAGPAQSRGHDGDDGAQCDAASNKPLPAFAGAIYAGTRQPALLPLDAAQQDAVVGVTDAASLADFGTFCSGTLVSDDVVLTAQHCTAGAGDGDLLVLFGVNELDPKLVIESVEVREHPAFDLALIRLAHAPREDIAVTPIPVAFAPPAADEVGSLVENAGYGDTDDGSEGRYFVTELYAGLDGTFLVVNGEGRRGVCYGDSGGPMMHVSQQGDVRVLGALSFGDNPCGSVDEYQRVDLALDFVEAMTGPTPAGAPQPCANVVTHEGRCAPDQSYAEWCEDDVVQRDVCAADEICGHTGEGARCVPIAQNACSDVTRFGSCHQNVLTWCDDDAIRVLDCTACDERCELADDLLGFACVAGPCGALDETGTCDGDVARWCEDDVQESEDCAAQGLTCGYTGEELGYSCYDAEACEGLDYAGRCDGDVLRWCENNRPQAIDCGEAGLTCAFVDDSQGYDCE